MHYTTFIRTTLGVLVVALSVCCMAFSGVHVFEKVCVERVEVENGRVCGVKTNKGDIKCEVFVNCGGQV